MTLQCNVISHRLGALTKWSLQLERFLTTGEIPYKKLHQPDSPPKDSSFSRSLHWFTTYLSQAGTKWFPFCRQHAEMHFLQENCFISIQVSPKFVCKGQISNKLALVQIIMWHQRGDKSLSESMIALFTDEHMNEVSVILVTDRHQALPKPMTI